MRTRMSGGVEGAEPRGIPLSRSRTFTSRNPYSHHSGTIIHMPRNPQFASILPEQRLFAFNSAFDIEHVNMSPSFPNRAVFYVLRVKTETGLGRRRQPSLGGTSRISRKA